VKNLLTLTAVIELVAGVALLCWPSATVALLLGSGLDTPAAVTLGRVAGAALFALGIANWLAQRDEQSGAARGVITAMTFYNLGAVVILGAAGIQLRRVGLALWPVVLLHAVMTVWCVTCLQRKPSKITENPQ
jgi:hypothetical protein